MKWVRGLEFLDHEAAGFWEQNGYHMYGTLERTALQRTSKKRNQTLLLQDGIVAVLHQLGPHRLRLFDVAERAYLYANQLIARRGGRAAYCFLLEGVDQASASSCLLTAATCT